MTQTVCDGFFARQVQPATEAERAKLIRENAEREAKREIAARNGEREAREVEDDLRATLEGRSSFWPRAANVKRDPKRDPIEDDLRKNSECPAQSKPQDSRHL